MLKVTITFELTEAQAAEMHSVYKIQSGGSAGLPEVIADGVIRLMGESLPGEPTVTIEPIVNIENCPVCAGTGKDQEYGTDDCPVCGGSGRVK
jgi:hypothetical protein